MCPKHYKRLKAGVQLDAPSPRRTYHGMSKSLTYRSWQNMIARCHNSKHKEFFRYGARGIFVCTEWRHDFTAFYEHAGERPSRLYSINRIDPTMGYEPGNVEWSTASEQSRNLQTRRDNRTGYKGITKEGERYRVCIWVHRNVSVGRYPTFEEALSARFTAECLYWS